MVTNTHSAAVNNAIVNSNSNHQNTANGIGGTGHVGRIHHVQLIKLRTVQKLITVIKLRIVL